MANRYGRDLGRQDRERRDTESYGGRNFGRSGSYGSAPFDDDERYFGGSRRYGEGYGSESYDRDLGRYGSDYGESGSNYGRSEGGRYREGTDYSQGWGGETGPGGYSRYSRGGRSGMGSSGSGYSGRGMGYGNYGSTHFEDRWGGQGGEDIGRYRSGYGSSYPSSERNYTSDYDEGDRGWWDKTSDEVASWFGDEEAARRRRMDERMGGGHRGRGPSGYSRSDDRIKEDINDRLTDYDYIDATNITCEVQNGDVTLSGTVDSRYEKRMAEDIAEDVSGVKNVENRLRVNSNLNASTTGSSKTATSTTGTTTGTQARGKSSGT
jgi:osmotically-inducible protein OsmY